MTLQYLPWNQYSYLTGDDLIRYSEQEARGTTIVTMVYGDESTYLIRLPAGNNRQYQVYAGDGDDHVYSLSTGNDKIYGEGGDDYLVDAGGGNDLIDGGAGDDDIDGGYGNDWLYGGAGDDLIVGNSGDDQLWGGTGIDTFDVLIRENVDISGRDIIHDFDPNADVISVRAYLDGPHHPPVPSKGTADNYVEASTAAGTSLADIEGAAQSVFAADSDIQYCFIADGTDGYLFIDIFDGPDTMVTLKGVGSVDAFSWNLIV